MKRLTAVVILAAATLAGPVAVGQSQLLPQTEALVASAVNLFPGHSVQSFEGAAAEDSTAPRPVASWVMAFAFLGFVALRRIGS
jgi:hypothetical protein